MLCQFGHLTPTSNGIVHVRPTEADELTRQTLESFGYEWTTFSRVESEDEAFWETYFRDVPLDQLKNAVALDAGCGKGRYSYFLAPHVRALAALDASAAIESAATNLAAQPNVTLFHCDLREVPFADQSFDFVCCLGVLHHLSDPRAGFRSLVRVLAPGGRLLIYVYSRPDCSGARAYGLAAASYLRRLTPRLPHRMLRTACAPVAAALYASLVAPGVVGEWLHVKRLAGLPLANYRHQPLRSLWLDTFDRLSAPVEHRYVWSEIESWFHAEGLQVQAVREEAGLYVLAQRRPA